MEIISEELSYGQPSICKYCQQKIKKTEAKSWGRIIGNEGEELYSYHLDCEEEEKDD